ncbi:MAG: AraC family ligand binding domain-containing protein, partial [Clostridia bacterium]|nr:AraC family ligand binding domain-containing protein [Clostridia bacterium]
MEFKATNIKKVFNINKIVTVHYFEYEKDYSFIGEAHNFWEIVYVDRGEIEIEMDNEIKRLGQGSIAFHEPGEYHNLRANGIVAPNLIIVSFVCNSPAMSFFSKRILPLSDIEKHLLATIIQETIQGFSSPLEDTFLPGLTRRCDAIFGSEQMISTSLEQLLISLYRNFGEIRKNSTTLKRGIEQDVLSNVLSFLQDNICEKLTLQQIADAVGISCTGLKTLFKERMGEGVISHFSNMKMDIAKAMIREGK